MWTSNLGLVILDLLGGDLVEIELDDGIFVGMTGIVADSIIASFIDTKDGILE
jgi:hypothetical protein